MATGTQIGQNRKNQIPHWIPKPKNMKTENQMLKSEKSTNRNEHKNRKTEVFWHKN